MSEYRYLRFDIGLVQRFDIRRLMTSKRRFLKNAVQTLGNGTALRFDIKRFVSTSNVFSKSTHFRTRVK